MSRRKEYILKMVRTILKIVDIGVHDPSAREIAEHNWDEHICSTRVREVLNFLPKVKAELIELGYVCIPLSQQYYEGSYLPKGRARGRKYRVAARKGNLPAAYFKECVALGHKTWGIWVAREGKENGLFREYYDKRKHTVTCTVQKLAKAMTDAINLGTLPQGEVENLRVALQNGERPALKPGNKKKPRA